MNLRDEINDILNSIGIEGIHFERLNIYQSVLSRFSDSFLAKGQESLKAIWLWEEFRCPYTSFHPDDALEKLRSIIDAGTIFWFIVTDEDGKYWVLKGFGSSILRLLSESRCFEYYIVDSGFNSVICENHHGVFIVKGEIANRVSVA